MSLAAAVLVVVAAVLGGAGQPTPSPSPPTPLDLAGDPDRPGEPRVLDVDPRVLDVDPRVLDVEPRVLDVPPRVVDVVVETGPDTTIVLAADVLFAFGSAELPPGADGQLAGVVQQVRERGPGTVRVAGHTDGIGEPGDNQLLSEARAAAVRDALLASLAGTAVPAFEVRGFGETQPLAAEVNPDGSDDPAGRARNRRVDVTLVP